MHAQPYIKILLLEKYEFIQSERRYIYKTDTKTILCPQKRCKQRSSKVKELALIGTLAHPTNINFKIAASLLQLFPFTYNSTRCSASRSIYS